MISLKTLAERLNTTLNALTLQGIEFVITADTAEYNRSIRQDNDKIEKINGLLKIQTSDVTTLTSGEMVATLTCRLQIIFKLDGEEEDFAVKDPETGVTLKTIYGNKSKIESIRKTLTDAFQKNEQIPLTDTDGTTYNTTIIYSLVETGERAQVNTLGDSAVFSAYIFYFFVENGINTNNVEYFIDGIKIPFQGNTTYRTPTTDGNVYANTIRGEVRNVQTQSIFSVSFELPALKNDVTKAIFSWIFEGQLNNAHLLNIRVPSFTSGTDDYYYLVTFGENKAIGETVKNVGQNMSLVEIVNDYDLLSFPSRLYIYHAGADISAVVTGNTNDDLRFLNISTLQGGKKGSTLTATEGDFIIATHAITNDLVALETIQTGS